MTTSIVLTPNEMYLASIVGIRRRFTAQTMKYNQRFGGAGNSVAEQWFFDIVGAQGEFAAAKALNVFWAASLAYDKSLPDLFPDWQIRTLANHGYDLIVRDDDIDDHKYVLLTGTGPEFQIHGWIYAKDAKRKEWFKDRGGRGSPCYWVPQSELKPIKEFLFSPSENTEIFDDGFS